MNIGRAMKDLREEAVRSRADLAKALGITTGALWKIENGKTWPKPATISKFCKEMKVELARLFCTAFEAEDYKI